MVQGLTRPSAHVGFAISMHENLLQRRDSVDQLHIDSAGQYKGYFGVFAAECTNTQGSSQIKQHPGLHKGSCLVVSTELH